MINANLSNEEITELINFNIQRKLQFSDRDDFEAAIYHKKRAEDFRELLKEKSDESMAKKMARRFLCWKLPRDFSPDGFVKFDRSRTSYSDPYGWPVGTNLLTEEQAVEMFECCMIDLP